MISPTPPLPKAADSPARPGLRVERVTDLDGLETHAAAWDALGAASTAPVPLVTATHAWTASHVACRLDESETWSCYLAYDGETLVGALPVARRPHPLLQGRVAGHDIVDELGRHRVDK